MYQVFLKTHPMRESEEWVAKMTEAKVRTMNSCVRFFKEVDGEALAADKCEGFLTEEPGG